MDLIYFLIDFILHIDVHLAELVAEYGVWVYAIPFVAGMGHMSYRHFAAYNVIGALLWVLLFTYAGYFFGTIPMVQDNLKLLIVGIIVVSILPGVIEIIRHKRAAARAAK